MTACVNRKHTKKVAAVVTASLVGALSLGVAPVAAVADTGIDMLAGQTDQQTWDASTFKWNVTADEYGVYSVEPGDAFVLESVTDVYGNEISTGDYMVVYFNGTGTGATAVAAGGAIDNQDGGMPKSAGSYTAAVVKLDGTAPTITTGTTISSLAGSYSVHTQAFTVASQVKTLDGAYAFEGTNADDVDDTTFAFNGGVLDVSFADAEGDVIASTDIDVKWLTDDPTTSVTNAGTYTALLTGKAGTAYEGSQATVSFNVAKLDLSKANIVIPVVEDSTGLDFSNTNVLDDSVSTSGGTAATSQILVDGEPVAPGVLKAELVSITDTTGNVNGNPSIAAGTVNTAGTYMFNVSNNTGSTTNVTGQPVAITTRIVNEMANVLYNEEDAGTYFTGREFETSKGEGFDPSLITAIVPSSGDEVPVKVTVTKDGQEVSSYAEPGEYKVSVEVAAPATCAYGASESFTFRVVSKTITGTVKVFASIDGKAAEGESFPYTGEAYTPSVVVKAGKKVLTAGEDYTVSYRVKGEKDEIESMVEPEDYQIVVSFPGTGMSEETVDFTIDKATIKSVKPASPVYAYTGEAIKPDFVGYTGAKGTGTEVALPNSAVGVKYIEAINDDNGTPDYVDDDFYRMPDGSAAEPIVYISAANLKDEGVYYAEVSVNSNDEHYKGSEKTYEYFQISKKSAFADVNASAWYAGAVYQAKELGYVNGISGTNLFAPEADITRADAVCILFNMAGGKVGSNDFSYDEMTGYNTGFSDVDGHSYFAKALAWAHNSGVANGSNGEFRPYDQITREEFASLLANFAKSKGEYVAADESALDGMSDASSVSDWAKENVAWAVSNKVMGNGGFIAAQDNIIRAEVAAMAVNYQPEAL